MSVPRRVDINLVFSQESSTFEIISFLIHFLLIFIIKMIAIFLQFFGNGSSHSQKFCNRGPYSQCFGNLTVSPTKAHRHR